LTRLAQAGITSVHDAYASAADLRGYQDARAAGELRTRVYCLIGYWDLERMLAAGVRTGLGDNWILQDRPVSNLELVETFANLAQRCGRGVATPEEARRMMGMKPLAAAKAA